MPLIEGLDVSEVLRLADGPEPPDPAHAAQLCHPDIFWSPDFTVWAEDDRVIRETMAMSVSTSQLLLKVLNI